MNSNIELIILESIEVTIKHICCKVVNLQRSLESLNTLERDNKLLKLKNLY